MSGGQPTPDRPKLVRRDKATRVVYATDNSVYQRLPEAVAVPATVAELADLLAENHAATDRLPVVARGGGTGTNGQSLSDGLIVDTKRRLCRIIEVDATNRIAVVEPGVVADELNRRLADDGLFWAPHASTVSRATVGGMIATDAAGKGSMVYGRTNRHVQSVELLLADGSLFRAEPVTVAEAGRRAGAGGPVGRIWEQLLTLDRSAIDRFTLPELARGFTGYGIDRLHQDGMINPVPLIVGSEGTLGIVVTATLTLQPLPADKRLIVAFYSSFDDALADAVELRRTGPTAIETFDELTLQAGQASPAWAALADIVPAAAQAVLLIEFSRVDHRPPTGSSSVEPLDLEATTEMLAGLGRCRSWSVIDDGEQQRAAWKIRADAVGLLAKVEVGGPQLSARPTAFVEDCAVPVAAMRDFIAEFRAILDGHGLTYAMFGHADVGCVHVRPALDTTDPAHERMLVEVSDQVVEAVGRHGGLLWGEHGRGLRSAAVDQFLHPDVVAVMRRIKTAFDPDDLFNPGKLYRPDHSSEPLLTVDDVALRGHYNRSVPVEVRRRYHHAFACNGNGLCHHHHEQEVMCPSYQATRDPALSPKGRADLMRHWLWSTASGRTHDGRFEDDLADNLGQCLSCSACTGRCPVEVDIPELKSRFLERYYSDRRRPVAHYLLSHFEQAATVASRVAPLANLGLTAMARALGLVDLPPIPAQSRPGLRSLAEAERDGCGAPLDLVVVPDVFSAVLEPEVLAATGAVLAALGYQTALADLVPSGKFDHVKGRRPAFTRAARRQADLIERVRATGAKAVVLEPATSLLHHHEYRLIDPGYPSEAVVGLATVVADRRHRLPRANRHGHGRAGSVRLLGHCAEQAIGPGWLLEWTGALAAAGFDVDAGPVGCCGMAGIFGHEKDNQELSKAVWNAAWAGEIEAARSGPAPVTVAATGYSCRSQSARLAGVRPVHPIVLLAQTLGRPSS